MDVGKLMPSLGADGLVNLLLEGRWLVDHGSIGRFPEVLRPDDGALSNIAKLDEWPSFYVGYRDAKGNYRQVPGSGKSAVAHYNRGALVNSRSINEATVAAEEWLDECAETLHVSRDVLRLNSWAVRGSNGIDWHYDPEDVIHFQIKGDKRFKFLRTPNTRFADAQTKRFESILVAKQSFAEASEEIVREGTITVIPRGVWHWTEGKSGESFAVSLCISSATCAQTLSQALYKRLRQMERNRMPLFGSPASQRQAMEVCMKEAGALLQAMDSKAVLSQECQLEFPIDNIGSLYFYLGKRAHARPEPLQMLVDGKEITTRGGEADREVLRAICKSGDGFRAQDVKVLLPSVDSSLINETLVSLVGIGFLDFLEGDLDRDFKLRTEHST